MAPAKGMHWQEDTLATLDLLLQQMSHADLRAVATRLGLRRRQQHSKAQWAAAIAAAWHDEQLRLQWLAALTPGANAALLRLVEAGELPAGLFWGTFGKVRRAVEARREQTKPWQKPQNPAEELYYLGLLHPLGARTLRRAGRVQLASDVRSLLAQGLAVAPAVAVPVETAAVLLHDLGQLLIFCQASPDLRLLHDRWLRVPDLAALNLRLAKVQPARSLSSHRRNAWIAFLALLAACARLQDAGKLTATGWAWLRMTPADQLLFVWKAWLQAPADLRVQFGGAGMDGVILRELLCCLPGQEIAFSVAQVASWLAGASAGFSPLLDASFASLPELETAVRRLLVRELAYFGIAGAAAGPPHASRRFVVTPLGGLLLAGQPVELQAGAFAAVAASGETTLHNEWQIKITGYAVTAAQAVIAQYATHLLCEPPSAQAPWIVHTYSLSESTVHQAAVYGGSLPSLLAALQEAGVHCTAEQNRLLATWAASGKAIRLHVQALLETDTPALLAELLRRPALARRIGRVLRPTLAVVKGSRAELGRELRTAGYAAAGARARSAMGGARRSKGAAKDSRESSAASAALWLAGMVYAELGRFAPLPIPPPYNGLAALYEQLPAPERAAVESQLAEVTANLLRWLDHFSFAPPPEASEPMHWLPMIHEAIATGRLLVMGYFSAGRNLLVRYVVEPYWVEEHQGAAYLRGDPQTGSSEAILFRLDRIQSLAWAEPQSGPDRLRTDG